MLFSGRFNLDRRLLFVVAAILIAIAIHFFGWDQIIATNVHSFGLFGSFLVGAFYTFGLTTPTAFILILEIMAINDAISTAIAAAFSAAMVDTILFLLLKDQLEKNTVKIIGLIRKKISGFNMAFPIVGFFIFGSPLPDELGLALMGIIEIKPLKIFIIVFLAKVITLLLAYNAINIL